MMSWLVRPGLEDFAGAYRAEVSQPHVTSPLFSHPLTRSLDYWYPQTKLRTNAPSKTILAHHRPRSRLRRIIQNELLVNAENLLLNGSRGAIGVVIIVKIEPLRQNEETLKSGFVEVYYFNKETGEKNVYGERLV